MLGRQLAQLSMNEEKEEHVLGVCRELIAAGDYEGLLELLRTLQDVWQGLSTVRLTKIVKKTFELVPLGAESYEGVLRVLRGLIEATADRQMLRLDLECREVHVLLGIGRYAECLERIKEVAKELKRIDDKTSLISLYVYESRAFYELRDAARARASLTSARALAVSAACPAQLQAQIDLLNGMYLSDEQAYDTSISYFTEATEGFVQDGALENGRTALRYLVLAKIMGGHTGDMKSVLDAKYAHKIRDDAFLAILLRVHEACQARDLKAYSTILSENGALLETDGYAYRHLQRLYSVLLDRNILKIIEPYSHVRLAFIAQRLGSGEDVIEAKLRKMILDKAIDGILDHVSQCLILSTREPVQNVSIADEIAAIEMFFNSQ